MSANFMGGPRVALARIRDSRKQKLQQNALAQGATGAAAAGASTRRDAAGEDKHHAEAATTKGQRQHSISPRVSPQKKRRKDDADVGELGRSIDTTANERDLEADEGGSRTGSAERASAGEHEDKRQDEQHRPSPDTSPDLAQKRRLLLDHDDWLGTGEIEGILRKKRKKGESSKGKREKRKTAAASAPGEDHGQELSGSREGDRGRTDVANHDRGEVGRRQHASEEQAHQVVTSSRSDDQDAGRSSSTTHERASSTKLQQHPHASEPLLTTKGLPALSLHPEALYTNSIKGLFTSGALGKGAAMTSSEEARSTTKCSADIPYSGDEDASKGDTNAAKPTLKEAPRGNGGQVAEAGADGELDELEGLLFKQREDTRRRLLDGC